MKCDSPGCTGSHSSNDWRNMCPAARERKRFRQAQWVRNKYWTGFGWATNKRWDNWCYKGTLAGILSTTRSSSAVRFERLQVILSHVELREDEAKAGATVGGGK
jgi:hypothetical protein